MYLGHSHLRLLLLLEELLLEQLEAVLRGQRGDGGRGAGAARAEQLLGAGQVEGAVFGILGTKKWAGEQIDRLRVGFGSWFPMALTPEQQRSPRTPGTEGDVEGQPLVSASDLHICRIPRTECFRETPPRDLAGLPWLCLGRAGPQVSQEGDSRERPKRSTTFPCCGCPGWAVSWCLEHLPVPVATALPAPALPCLGSARRNVQENPAFPTRKRIPWSACHCSCFQPGPASVTVV